MKKMKTWKQRQNRSGYLFMLPWIIGFAVFTAFPFIATIALSFTNVNSTILGFEITWAGIENYITAFFKNVEFVPALGGYLKMVIPYTFVIVVVSFIIAYILEHIVKLKGFFRTIYFLPVIIMSGPVMAKLLDTKVSDMQLFAGQSYSDIFIIQMIASYSRRAAVLMTDIFEQLSTILWFTGIPIVLFINGLQKINPSLYEAAKIDSANSWQILWKITLPIIRPIALVITIFTIAQLGMYDINPVYSLIVTYMGNTSGGLGFAATYAWVYTLIVLLLMGAAFLIFKERKSKVKHY
ncbi:MAG: sugar ABC transporter permease [Lachnospiraceae bacterium]|nr:sugar ABC transporter permease [Lachnospiraceae bacterium]MBP5652783.1 sugar ABC transporter permease [Lachnospiraceae bacterium]